MYGISQNPNTKDYIIVSQNVYCSGHKKIDSLIQEMQLRISSHSDIVFEWIPYSQFDNIEEIGRGDYATVHSAIWKDVRKSDKKVVLKCLYNSQNITNEFLNEVWNFLSI